MYSLLQTCKVNGINSYRYLCALLVALPLAQTADDYEALLPWNLMLPTEYGRAAVVSNVNHT